MRTQHATSAFGHIARLVGAHGIMAGIIEAYFDESEATIGNRVFAVAGYLLWPDQARLMEDEWQSTLDRYGLPFFHMADCAADPGHNGYERLSKDQRIALVSELIGIIKKRTQRGISVITNPSAFLPNDQDKTGKRNYYNVSVSAMITYIAVALNVNRQEVNMFYHFESGHHLQSTANRVIAHLINSEDSQVKQRYAGHSFLPKERSPLLQAGDLLAWQSAKDVKNQIQGRARRRDFLSLLEHRHTMLTIVPGDDHCDYVTHYDTPPGDIQLTSDGLKKYFQTGGISRRNVAGSNDVGASWTEVPAINLGES